MLRTLMPITMLAAATLISCGGSAASTSTPSAASSSASAATITFDRDSAYANVAAQCDFGPRVPGSDAHRRCGQWLTERLRASGADTLIVQPCTMTAYDGTQLALTNIMAQYNPEATSRLLLVAHWDTRHVADQDSDPALRNTPIDGANDGASGVGVLLEVARQIGIGNIPTAPVGIDILLVDGEDYGAPDEAGADEDSWCLGTQYWVRHTPYPAGTAVKAILLDMVGGRDAVFNREILSEYFAPGLNDAIWTTAARLGLSGRFGSGAGGGVTDDHLHLNRAGIPAIDIIESSHPDTGSFNPTWHTHEDNIDNIDPATLGDVGAVVTEYIKTLQK